MMSAKRGSRAQSLIRIWDRVWGCRGPTCVDGPRARRGDDPRARAPSTPSGYDTERRCRDIGDLPDLPGERDDVGGVVDDLERGRPVQPTDDGRDGAVAVHPHECTGVRIRRSPLEWSVPEALREGEERAPPAELHVNGEPDAGGYDRGVARAHTERQHLAVLRNMWDGSGLGDVDPVSPHGQAGRDHIV